MSGGCDEAPSVEEWTNRVRAASSDEVQKLRQHVLGCLAQNVKEQRWGVLAGIAAQVLLERNVQFK